jgi:hypothetical protein
MIEYLSQPVSRLLSPTLRGFEINPFRVLRLPVHATTSEASFQAERALTLVRAGLSPEEPDPLPWLPPTGIYELQQAAQTIEEPLLRLTEQLLWFDFVRDSSSESLQLMLREFKWEILSKHLNEEILLPKAGEYDSADEAGIPLVAQAINQANLRLLISASMMNRVLVEQSAVPTESKKIASNEWQKLHGLIALPEAHKVIADAVDGGESWPKAWAYWEGALRRWTQILSHPWFRLYLGKCISDLSDDFASTDDMETIEESIRTRLADLSAKETRFLLLEGRYNLAGAMITSVSRTGLETRVLGPALRPIHHLFQSELSELQSLLDESEQDGVAQIDAYLKRLAIIKKRWLAIDKPGIIGLSHLLDDAIEQAYLRLRRGQPSPELDGLLVEVSKLATAKSLCERVNSYRKELEEVKSRVCYFCKTGEPNYDNSLVLEGKKETGRQRNYNSTTIYYAVRYGIVLRCERCAHFHDYLRKLGLLAPWTLMPGLVYLAFQNPDACVPFVIGIILVFLLTGFGVTSVVAMANTPSGHTRYGTYIGTNAYNSLRAEGYSVTAHWKSDAVSSLKNKN